VARTDGTTKPQSAGGAASYKKPIEARCRRALRGPNGSRTSTRKYRPAERPPTKNQSKPAVGGPSAARTDGTTKPQSAGGAASTWQRT